MAAEQYFYKKGGRFYTSKEAHAKWYDPDEVFGGHDVLLDKQYTLNLTATELATLANMLTEVPLRRNNRKATFKRICKKVGKLIWDVGIPITIKPSLYDPYMRIYYENEYEEELEYARICDEMGWD